MAWYRVMAVNRPARACSSISLQVIALPPPRGLRGMIATFRPALPRHDHGWTVHLQPGDSSTSYWTQAVYSRPTVKPLEMFRPRLCAGVEQRHTHPRFWVSNQCGLMLAAIAVPAGQTQVFQH